MGALVRAAEWAEWAAEVVTCRVIGHDWRTWTIAGTDVQSIPICERCGVTDRRDRADAEERGE